MAIAPYGSWASPVTVDTLTSSSVRLGAPIVAGSELYWIESRPDQGGRSTLLRRTDAGTEELTPPPYNVRSRVHEYGGGAYAACPELALFSDYSDGRLYVVRGHAEPAPLTPPGPHRFADLRLHPERDLVLAVREDHSGAGEPVNTIVALRLGGDNAGGGTVVCSGADFYASPELSPDGRLAWIEWDHPNMPWDATRLLTGELPDQLTDQLTGGGIRDVRQLAGGPAESVIHPRWLASGRLVFVSDRTGWWNLYSCSPSGVTALHPAPHDFASPPWVLGQNPYAELDDEHLLVTWVENGVGAIGRLTLSTQEIAPLAPPGTATSSLSVDGGQAAAVLTSPDAPSRLALLEPESGHWTEVRRSSEVVLDAEVLSTARQLSWPSDQGDVYGWFYLPKNDRYSASAGTRPPLIIWSHGGPTDFARADFDLEVQFWTSRGVAILDVNYGGSAGYGRDYRERLKGRWGLVDVADCARGAQVMGEQGLADPDRLAIAGGSAGGYTTLGALTTTDVFSAGMSRYGVGDLEGLARDTHKFEARYLDGLVGPYPEAAEVYRDRSPVRHVDQLSAPILLLQGDEDQVVPLNQAEAMAAAARAKGLPVALIVFPGEGHGFRRAENIRSALQAELYFLGRVFGFSPADELPGVEIENLRAS